MNKCCKDMENTIHEQNRHIRDLKDQVDSAKCAIGNLYIEYLIDKNNWEIEQPIDSEVSKLSNRNSQHIRTLREAIKLAISKFPFRYSKRPDDSIEGILRKALKETDECEGDEK